MGELQAVNVRSGETALPQAAAFARYMYSEADFGVKVIGSIQISPSATLLTASLSYPLQNLEGH
jgi:hypothetical protein